MVGFIIWALCGIMFIAFGIAAFKSKNPTGFWANAKMCDVNDVNRYNYAVGKMWCIFGGLFIVIGVPLLAGDNSPLVFISVIGCVVWVIALMLEYELVIMKKYRK